MTGFVVEAGGYDAGFFVLAAIAAAALLFYGLAMPETRTDREIVESPARTHRPAIAIQQTP